MALSDEHGGAESPETKGRIAYYRGESRCPYPPSHSCHDSWWSGFRTAAEREEAHRRNHEERDRQLIVDMKRRGVL